MKFRALDNRMPLSSAFHVHEMKTKEEIREYQNQWKKENRIKVSAQHKRWVDKNREKINIYNRRKNQERRLKVLVHYSLNQILGCSCCGEINPDFLTIDHINNDGAKHRREINRSGGGSPFYNWLIINEFPEGFQTLCANCQLGKVRNFGKCNCKNWKVGV